MNKETIKELGIAIDTRTPKEKYKEDLEPFILETISEYFQTENL